MKVPISNTQRFGWQILNVCLGVMLMLTAVLAGPWLERHFFPVVESFVVEEAQPANGGIIISGTMDKVRDCRFVEMAAYAKSPSGLWRAVNVDFSPDGVIVKSRPAQEQAWGPWLVAVPSGYTSVSMTVRHQCHFAYETVTDLVTFEVPK